MKSEKELKCLIGKYLNGYRIEKVEKDPFIEDQINLWTDGTKLDFLSNREIVKFCVRNYPSGASIYKELIDKENYKLKNIIIELEKWARENFYINGDEVVEKIKELQEDIDLLTSDDDNDSVWLEELNK